MSTDEMKTTTTSSDIGSAAISADKLAYAETLAFLRFYPAERDLAQETMDDFFQLFDLMADLPSESGKPMISPRELESSLRDDVQVKFETREDLLKNAPHPVDCYFSAPQTFD